jgi:Tfp pilus assembly protein PilZ
MSGDPGPSNTSAAESRRKSPRKGVSIPCALRIREQVYAARLLDLSAGGAFVQTGESFALGTELAIIFKAQGRTRMLYLNLKAKAVYVGRFVQGFDNFNGFGAFFMNPSVDDVAKLGEILDRYQEDPAKKFEFM